MLCRTHSTLAAVLLLLRGAPLRTAVDEATASWLRLLWRIVSRRSPSRFGADVPWVTVHLATSFEVDLRRYSSSSTVPFRPDPTLRSIFRLVLELRLTL